MLNEDILLQELKKDFNKTLDQVDKKINTDVYDILPCYIKKKLILKITKEELINGTYSLNNNSRYINLNKHLEINKEKKYYINFLNQEFCMYSYPISNGVAIGYMDSTGSIMIYPNLYYNVEQDKEITDKEHLKIDLIEEYINIETDLEIYEIVESKKIDTELMPETIYLENEGNYISISPNCIGLNGCFDFNRESLCLNIYKPISFSGTINNDSDDNILVSKEYVDTKANAEKITEISRLSDSSSDIDKWLKDSTSNIRIVSNQRYFTIDNDKYDYFMMINNKRYNLSPFSPDRDYNVVGIEIIANKEKKYILSLTIGGKSDDNYFSFRKNELADFGITVKDIFGESSFYLTLYRSEKQKNISSNQFIPSHVNINHSLQVGNVSNIQGDKSFSVGEKSLALGNNSVAIGDNLIASCDNQFVSGKYNKPDVKGEYVHIVGAGEENIERNIHTLDWEGNSWFKKDVYVGGYSQSEGNKLLSTKDISFNENGELVVTINGVTKTFVPKSE